MRGRPRARQPGTVAVEFVQRGGHQRGHVSRPVAIVLGAVLVVTGPTVILPLLREQRFKLEAGWTALGFAAAPPLEPPRPADPAN